MEAIRALALEVEARWRAANYADAAFPEIAAEAVRRAELHARIQPDDIVRWAMATPDLPQQASPTGGFGQPPLTLFFGRKFYIDALFWIDATTTIHEHAFSGAFQVLSGSSVQTEYTFTPGRVVNGGLQLGALDVVGSRLLRAGDVEPIRAGRAFIHALFHLDRPSVSLVVRTRDEPAAAPQMNYTREGVAYDPFLELPWSRRIVELARTLANLAHPDLEAIVGDTLATSDSHTAFQVLGALRRLVSRDLHARLLERTRTVDAEVAAAFTRVFEASSRDDFLVARRADVRDPDLRFFLALLLNVGGRDALLALTRSHGGGDPVETVVDWLERLSKITVQLQAFAAPWTPNVFALPEFDEPLRAALRRRLSGVEAAPQDAGAAASLERIERAPSFRVLFT